MYKYEIIIGTNKVKSDDFKHIIKILRWLLENNYVTTFINNDFNTKMLIENEIDIDMLVDNMED